MLLVSLLLGSTCRERSRAGDSRCVVSEPFDRIYAEVQRVLHSALSVSTLLDLLHSYRLRQPEIREGLVQVVQELLRVAAFKFKGELKAEA